MKSMIQATLALFFILVPGFALAQEASSLGPAPSSTGTDGSTGQTGPASPQTSSVLQPAGAASGSSLQSSDSASGGVTQAPSGNALQQSGSASDLKLFVQGGGDGTGSSPAEEESSIWEIIGAAALALGALGLIALFWRL